VEIRKVKNEFGNFGKDFYDKLVVVCDEGSEIKLI
jgi:hypothetical protein